MHKRLLFVFLFFFSSWLWADCKTLLPSVIKALHPSAMLKPSYLNTCKVWSYLPNKTLVVMILFSDIQENVDETAYDVDVAVVDSNSGQVLSHYFTAKAIIDDAIRTDHIAIDTARYQLNSSTRAFGVRFHHRNHSRLNPYFGEGLNLYYLKGNTLRLALNGLGMTESYGDWDESKCSGEFKDIRRTLVIQKEQQHGFNNLKIIEYLNEYKLKPIKPYDCTNTDEKVSKHSQILKFNGRVYDVPKDYKY